MRFKTDPLPLVVELDDEINAQKAKVNLPVNIAGLRRGSDFPALNKCKSIPYQSQFSLSSPCAYSFLQIVSPEDRQPDGVDRN